jgi:hypothetical protein
MTSSYADDGKLIFDVVRVMMMMMISLSPIARMEQQRKKDC